MRAMLYPWRFLLLACLLACGVRADFAVDLASIHTEATGGRARLEALRNLKASGVTRGELGEMAFVLWAARPNRLCVEVSSARRTIRQGWDGRAAPWTSDTLTRTVRVMAGDGAEAFQLEAEFDNPVIAAAGKSRRVSLDYAGAVATEDGERLKLVATQNFTATSFVYLDPATYLIVRRDVVRRPPGGEVVVRTDYSDFRPVEGVILPHRLVVSQNGKRLRETRIDRMEANIDLPAGIFSAPPAGKN
jgi:hypothetical protein